MLPYMPCPQGVHTVLPSWLANEPATHESQVASLVAPTVVEYVPSPHWVHTLAAPKLYVPAWQYVSTVDPSVMLCTEVSMHEMSVGWHSGLQRCVFSMVTLPEAAGTHSVDPGSPEKYPEAHAMHVSAPCTQYT
jgi:hypothetical protein